MLQTGSERFDSQRSGVRIIQADDRLTLTCSSLLKRNYCGWLVFCVCWMGMGVVAVCSSWQAATAGNLIFVSIILFVLPTGIVVGCLVNLLGKERLEFGTDGMDYEWRVWRPLRHRHVPWPEWKRVRAGRSAPAQPSNRHLLIFDTMGRPLRFAQGITEEDAASLVRIIEGYIEKHRPSQPPTVIQHQLPSDSYARLIRQADGVGFCWRGHWEGSALAISTGVMVFLNFITTAMVVGSVNSGAYGALIIFLPFPLTGLLLLAAWLGLVLAPLCEETWLFRRHEVIWIYRCLGIPWRRRFVVPIGADGQPILNRLEVFQLEAPQARWSRWPTRAAKDAPFVFSMVDAVGDEFLGLQGLTEGEARCLADVLYESFPEWFGTTPGSAPSNYHPARPRQCAVHVVTRGDELVLSIKLRIWLLTFFFLSAAYVFAWPAEAFLAAIWQGMGWRVVCYSLIFFILWLCMEYLAHAVGRTTERLQLTPDGLHFRSRGPLTPGKRDIPLEDLGTARVSTTIHTIYTLPAGADGDHGYKADEPPLSDFNTAPYVQIETANGPIKFAHGINEADGRWLAWLLNQYAAAGRSTEAVPPPTRPAGALPRLCQGIDFVAFLCRGQWRLRTILGTLFVAGFWDGILLVMLTNGAPLASLIFLIPFLVVGLGFALFFLGVLTAPAWSLSWIFRENEITTEYRFLGILLRRRRQTIVWSRIAPRKLEPIQREKLDWLLHPRPLAFFRSNAPWSLSILGPPGEELLGIEGFTAAEAQWMAAVLGERFAVIS
jgi:hypothetical protein